MRVKLNGTRLYTTHFPGRGHRCIKLQLNAPGGLIFGSMGKLIGPDPFFRGFSPVFGWNQVLLS